jgi:hypothetical protein
MTEPLDVAQAYAVLSAATILLAGLIGLVLLLWADRRGERP